MAWTNPAPALGGRWTFDDVNELREAILERKAVAEFVYGPIADWVDPVEVLKGKPQSLMDILLSFHDCVAKLAPRFYVSPPVPWSYIGPPKYYEDPPPKDEWDKYPDVVSLIKVWAQYMGSFGGPYDWVASRYTYEAWGWTWVNYTYGDESFTRTLPLIWEHLVQMRKAVTGLRVTDLCEVSPETGLKQGFSAGPSSTWPPTPYDWKGETAYTSGQHATKSVEWEYNGGWRFKWNGQDRSMEWRGMLSANVPDLTDAPEIKSLYFGAGYSLTVGRVVGTVTLKIYAGPTPGAWDFGTLLMSGLAENRPMTGWIPGVMAHGEDPSPLVEGETNYLQLRVTPSDLVWDYQDTPQNAVIDFYPTSPCLIVEWGMAYAD